MSAVIRVDDGVLNELKRRAVELNMVFNTPNEVLKIILDLATTTPEPTELTFPLSPNPNVQKLIDGIRCTVLNLSTNGLVFHKKSERWVASPINFVAIKVQDKRKSGLAITIYGDPSKFIDIPQDLKVKPDRSSYSRFNIDREDQLNSAITMIKQAYKLKV